MDPQIIALIFAGLRLAVQAVQGTRRAKDRLADFEAFLVALHTEGREPTAEEAAHWVGLALQADAGLDAAIRRLKAAAAATAEAPDPSEDASED